MSQSTVHEYLARFQAAGLRWPLENGWDEEQLETALFPSGQTPSKILRRTSPDFDTVRQQLEQHRELTLELLWEEYREQHPDGYCYSRYVAAEFMLRDHLKAMTMPSTGDVRAT